MGEVVGSDLQLNIVIASTRPGRVGPAIATWVNQVARGQGSFDVHLIDLVDAGLPLYDEPHHPRFQRYEKEHTRAWSKSVAAADAFVLVTPEYNFGPTPALVNALNYVYKEWNYKPAAFVSYGGVSGGIRAVQMTKLILTTLKMAPILEAVTIPFVAQHIKAGVFQPEAIHTESARTMLVELHRWARALKPLRE